MAPDRSIRRSLPHLFAALAITCMLALAQTAYAQDSADEAPKTENFVVYMWKASPMFFIIMGGLSVYLGTVTFNCFQRIQLKKMIPPKTVQTLDAMLTEKKFKEAYETLRNEKSTFARSLTAGVEKLSHGFDRGMDAMGSVVEDEKMIMEHSISPIAVVAALAPMLGLLGTVLGMIFAFQNIAKGGQPKPAELAENIGLALISTLQGIVIAVPATWFFTIFRNKSGRIVFELDSILETYLWRFAAALKK